jgi:hypothetical protein
MTSQHHEPPLDLSNDDVAARIQLLVHKDPYGAKNHPRATLTTSIHNALATSFGLINVMHTLSC